MVCGEAQKSAVLSEDGLYRYRLSRWWGDGQRVVFLMMNPSTADASVDDATIRKCMGFARRWGYDGIEVVNLFALRSREPKVLLTASDPVGPENGLWLIQALQDKDEAICAWGCEDTLKSFNQVFLGRNPVNLLRYSLPHIRFMCLGKTKGGTPRHPLMLAYTTERQPL